MEWIDNRRETPNGKIGNFILKGDGFFLSYNDNAFVRSFTESHGEIPRLDSEMPETALVIENGKGKDKPRFLIFRGDHRKELEALYPDLEKMKDYWKERGGHFWSDSLDND